MLRLISGSTSAIGTTIVLGANLTLSEDANGLMQIAATGGGGGGGGGTVTGTGTTNRLALFTGSAVIGDSTISQTATGIVVGTDFSSTNRFRVDGSIAFAGSALDGHDGTAMRLRQLGGGYITLETGGSERMRVTAGGAVVYGVDPTGTELVRIGGHIKAQRLVTTDILALQAIVPGSAVRIEVGYNSIRYGYIGADSNAMVLQADANVPITFTDGFSTRVAIDNGLTWGTTSQAVGRLLRGGSGLADLQILNTGGAFRVINAAYSTVLFRVQNDGLLYSFGPLVLGASDIGSTDVLRVAGSGRFGGTSPGLWLSDSGTGAAAGGFVSWECLSGATNQTQMQALLERQAGGAGTATAWVLRHIRTTAGTTRDVLRYTLNNDAFVLSAGSFVVQAETLIQAGLSASRLYAANGSAVEVAVERRNPNRVIYDFLTGDGNYYGLFDSTASATRWRYSMLDNRVELYGSAPVLLNPGFNAQGNSTITGSLVVSQDITAFSDARLKVVLAPVTEALDRVRRMRPVWFEWIAEPGTRQLGLIAQELAAVVPEVVRTLDDERQTMTVDYGKLTALLIAAIQELADAHQY
jgi:hypothetical protein